MINILKKIYSKISFLIKEACRSILKLINIVLSSIGLRIQYQREIDFNDRQSRALASFYTAVKNDNRQLISGVSCIIFSMDRAIQLHALIGSLFDKLSTPIETYIMYRSTSPEHEKAYREVIELYENLPIHFIKQIDKPAFAPQLKKLLGEITTNKLFFLVDDILITENVNVDDLLKIECQKYVLSLRLGKHLTTCYTMQKPQRLPVFISSPDNQTDKLCWNWSDGQYDWGCALSVDGHLFLTKEVLAMTENISFSAPNTFEGNLQIFKPIFDMRLGLAYGKSRLFNIPCNKVQNEITNFHGNFHQDDLLKKWNDGYQIDYRKLYGFKNNGVHQEVTYDFIKRNDR